MKQKELAELTNEELLQEAKKIKSGKFSMPRSLVF
jgi:hypothetical protein